MADLLTCAGFGLSVSGVLLAKHCRAWWSHGAASLMFIGGRCAWCR